MSISTEPKADECAAAGTSPFVWHQIFAPDGKRSIDFYTQALDWEIQEYPFEEAGAYTMLAVNGRPFGGVVDTSDCPDGQQLPPHWAVSIAVDDVDARLAKCQSLGGKLLTGPMDVPTVGRMALIQDPQGATFWLFQPADEHHE